MMKRTLIPLLLVLCLMLSGCMPTAQTPAMYIEEAQLNQTERNIAQLLGYTTEQLIYDFKLDDTVRSLQLNTYQLIDGAWELISGGGGYAWSGKEGRLALEFEVLPDGMRAAIQEGEHISATRYTSAEPMDTTGLSRSTSRLSTRTAVTYGQEIPLVLQSFTDRSAHRSYMPDVFFTPELLTDAAFTHVYAITVAFSQEPLK